MVTNYSPPWWCFRRLWWAPDLDNKHQIFSAFMMRENIIDHPRSVSWDKLSAYQPGRIMFISLIFEQIYCKSIKHVSEDVAGHDVGNDFCWAPFWSPDHDYNDYHDDHDDDDIDHVVGNDFCWASFWSPEAQHVRLTWLWLATYNLNQPSGPSTLFFSSFYTSLISSSSMRLRFKNILSPEKD